jgi:hypothetical protein
VTAANGEPTVNYPIRDILSRMEAKIDKLGDQLREFEVEGSRTARDALSEGHALELRVTKLELASASALAVRWAIILAVVSGPGSALLTWLLTRH